MEYSYKRETRTRVEEKFRAMCLCPFFCVMQLLALRGILRCQPDILSQTYRSLHELTQFQSLVFSSGVSIVTCTETWLSPYVFDHGILSPSFTIFRKDRDGSGGGVLLAIKNFTQCLESRHR